MTASDFENYRSKHLPANWQIKDDPLNKDTISMSIDMDILPLTGEGLGPPIAEGLPSGTMVRPPKWNGQSGPGLMWSGIDPDQDISQSDIAQFKFVNN